MNFERMNCTVIPKEIPDKVTTLRFIHSLIQNSFIKTLYKINKNV